MQSESDLERREVHFSGRVQGVGFRYTTKNVARGFDVVGYVRNLATGQVLLVAEGRTGELDRFVEAIEDQMTGNITHADRQCGSASGEFETFEIRH